MGIKELLELLSSIPEDQLEEEDKAVLAEIAGKYNLSEPQEEQPMAPDQTPEHEAQETPAMESQEHLTGEEAMDEQPMPEQPAAEEMSAAQEPTPEVSEAEVEAAMAEPQASMEQTQDATAMLQEEISSLRESIEAIKMMLEKVAIREPVTEEEAEKSEESVGQKSKPGKMVGQEQNMTNALARRLGGY